MIPETKFADLYHETMGRPNFPVAVLVGLSILKEMFDLTDEALMAALTHNTFLFAPIHAHVRLGTLSMV